MPSRMIDYEAIWTSGRLKSCKESMRHEYVWLYGLADANGCFELNMDAIKSHVSAIRPKLGSARLAKIFEEFRAHGLLFTWISDGTLYGFWTNSDRSGRLPPETHRHRYKKFAPPIPKEALAEYEAKFRRDNIRITSGSGVWVGVGVGLDWVRVWEPRRRRVLGLGQKSGARIASFSASRSSRHAR
jgi:hypothetical protein